MRMLRALIFAVTYPVSRIGGALLSRLAKKMKNLSRRKGCTHGRR